MCKEVDVDDTVRVVAHGPVKDLSAGVELMSEVRQPRRLVETGLKKAAHQKGFFYMDVHRRGGEGCLDGPTESSTT